MLPNLSMANNSMNNWLGFSLSPQHPPPPQDFNPDEISGTDVVSGHECFDSILPSLNIPAPFGLLESFNTNNNLQDWNSSTNYKTSTTSELSMLMGSSSSCTNHSGPKLENFLGITNGDHHYMYQNCSLQLPAETAEAVETTTGGGGGGIGLSMIKNWLRNNPAPPPQPENNGGTLNGTNGTVQTLSLSMSTGSQSSSPLPLLAASSCGDGGGGGESSSSDNNKRQILEASHSQTTGAIEAVPRKSIDTFGQRTSIYRGVTRHRWTGRYEAHLWDNSCRREGQTRKGRQVYLGGYDKEDKAARSYDLAALKYWGTTTTTNFPISNYEKDVEEMKHMTRQEYVASLRRKSSGFSRGASIYRGVTRHHQHGRWQARIGRVAGNKDLYLGTFTTQEEAAEAYDIAAIKFRGLNAVTNFEINRYDVKTILESSTLPIGCAAKRLKEAEQVEMTQKTLTTESNSLTSHLTDGIPSYHTSHHNNWPNIVFQQVQSLPMNFAYSAHQRLWCKQEIPDTDTSEESYQNLHQLQLANNTHNFFQPSVMHNLINLDSSSLEHSSGSNSVMYGNGGGYGVPMGTILAQEGNQNPGFGENNYENPYGATDPYNPRNLCYLSQQSLTGSVKPSSVYDQGSACNNWIPTAVPALDPKTISMAVCHGAPTFTVWNDT